MPEIKVTRTQDEILTRINYLADNSDSQDFLGFRQEVLIGALDLEHLNVLAAARGADEIPATSYKSSDEVQAALSYLEFAWGKAADHRGISAGRSVQKLAEWAWLFGMDAVVLQMTEGPYQNYGAPALKVFAEAMGQEPPTSEALVNMMQGLPCRPDCNEGCGQSMTTSWA